MAGVPGIESKKLRRRLIGHQEPIGPIDDQDGVAQAVQNGLHVPFLSLGQLGPDLEVLQLLAKLPHRFVAVGQMSVDGLRPTLAALAGREYDPRRRPRGTVRLWT